jgi:deoxyribonuclease V
VVRLTEISDRKTLVAEQLRLAALDPAPWRPGQGSILAGGCFVAFARGQHGPGRRGDRAHVGAAVTRDTTEMTRVIVAGEAGASYEPGLLAAREGPLLDLAIRELLRRQPALDVILVDATGRDHPRRAGLALHLGAALDIPTVGVTHRPLLATGVEPDDLAGAASPLVLDGQVVGCWLRTRQGARPVAVHAAWRTDPEVAAAVVRRVTAGARTPEPLRIARMAAREARSATDP